MVTDIPRQIPHDRCVLRSSTGIPVLLDTLEPGDDRLPMIDKRRFRCWSTIASSDDAVSR
jgi:hypothetical protein